MMMMLQMMMMILMMLKLILLDFDENFEDDMRDASSTEMFR